MHTALHAQRCSSFLSVRRGVGNRHPAAIHRSALRTSATCRRHRCSPKLKLHVPTEGYHRFTRVRVSAAAENVPGNFHDKLQTEAERMDANQLQTALVRAINAEDYELAGLIRDKLSDVLGAQPNIDWNSLGLPEWLIERATRLGFKFPTEIQQRAARVILSGADTVLQSETGSGKTLAFLLPALARLDYPPKLFPEDLNGPELLVIVPTFELGVQVALLVYKLFGGSVNSGQPGDPANMFTYTGPRGIQVKGLLRDEEVDMAKHGPYLSKAHVVVATPHHLQQLISAPLPQTLIMTDCKVFVVDEVDECFKSHLGAMAELLRVVTSEPDYSSSDEEVIDIGETVPVEPKKTQVVFVGATVQPEQVGLSLQAGWMTDPVYISIGNSQSVPAGLQHRYIVVDTKESTPMAVLTRMLRQDLRDADQDGVPTRVIVFANSEEAAKEMSDPLRTVLWEAHRLSVLLPSGSEPVQALHSFRDNKATLLLCTPAASRGLDLPSVSHVYNMGPPPDGTQYLHRAGRAGRIGATSRGIITTIVTGEEETFLLEQARELRLEITKQEPPAPDRLDAATDTESVRKGLEDLFNLY